jgi:mannose-6-phosphate isomerase-like protein (cupin superfamily)
VGRRNFSRGSICGLMLALIFNVSADAAGAQSAASPSPMGWPVAKVQEQTSGLVAKAEKNLGGIATLTLSKTSGSYVMLSVRVKSGRAELHARDSDYIFVIDGEGTMRTGGSIVDGKTVAANEIRGLKLEGSSDMALEKGSMIHIPPGVPHQTMVAPGSKLIYFVVKAEMPAQ